MTVCADCTPTTLCDRHREVRRRILAERLAFLGQRITLREPSQ
jgi:hypothetical protein